MRTYMSGYGGKYEMVRTHLTDEQITSLAGKVATSEKFEFGDLSHIVLSGTETIVGFIGNDSVELCCPQKESSKKYRTIHQHLRRIFGSV